MDGVAGEAAPPRKRSEALSEARQLALRNELTAKLGKYARKPFQKARDTEQEVLASLLEADAKERDPGRGLKERKTPKFLGEKPVSREAVPTVADTTFYPTSSSNSGAVGAKGQDGGKGALRWKTERLQQQKELITEAVESAARAELLEQETPGYLVAEDGESTTQVTQRWLRSQLDLQTSKRAFCFVDYQLGPYKVDFAPNGRALAMASKKGHLAVLNMNKYAVVGEIQLKETVHDVAFCHDDRWIVVAQKEYAYMYTHACVEAHQMKEHIRPTSVTFLPRHFLIVSGGPLGMLVFQDISTGKLVAKKFTKMGAIMSMCQNPSNAVMLTGHSLGTVAMWSPMCTAPLVKMLCHKGPVASMTIDLPGMRLVTTSLDGFVKMWDLRMYRESLCFRAPKARAAVSCAFSQTGVLALACGNRVDMWRDGDLMGLEPGVTETGQVPLVKPGRYMTHCLGAGRRVENVKFCPFEDILGVGHRLGFDSVVVPGCGEANVDTFLPNPYETKSQRRERPVKQLLDKLAPELIVLDPVEVATAAASRALTPRERVELSIRQKRYELRRKAIGLGQDMQVDIESGSDDDGAPRRHTGPSGEELAASVPEWRAKQKARKAKKKPPKSAVVKRLHRDFRVLMTVKSLQKKRRAELVEQKAKKARTGAAESGAPAEGQEATRGIGEDIDEDEGTEGSLGRFFQSQARAKKARQSTGR